MIQFRNRNRQLLLLRRQSYSGQHLSMRDEHRRHQLLHIVTAGAFQENTDLVVDTVLIPPGDLLTLVLKSREAPLSIRGVPGPQCLKPADYGWYNESGELLRIFRARLRIGRDILHSLKQSRRLWRGFELSLVPIKLMQIIQVLGWTKDRYRQDDPTQCSPTWRRRVDLFRFFELLPSWLTGQSRSSVLRRCSR